MMLIKRTSIDNKRFIYHPNKGRKFYILLYLNNQLRVIQTSIQIVFFMSNSFELRKLLEGHIQGLSLDRNNYCNRQEAVIDFSIPISRWKSAQKASIQQFLSMNQLFFGFDQKIAKIYQQSLDHKFVQAQQGEIQSVPSFMIFPIPNTLRCQICGDKFPNYLKHINLDFHRTKMKKVSNERMMRKLVRMTNKTRPQYRLKQHLINQEENKPLVHLRKRKEKNGGKEAPKHKVIWKASFNSGKQSSKNK